MKHNKGSRPASANGGLSAVKKTAKKRNANKKEQDKKPTGVNQTADGLPSKTNQLFGPVSINVLLFGD